jgi:GT2 family glycosyltransferase
MHTVIKLVALQTSYVRHSNSIFTYGGKAPKLGVDKSIIITNYNGRTDLERCLLSLRQHNSREDTEIIVIDNASPDHSVDYIRQTFPEVIVVENASNQGYGHGNNLGVRCSRGQYLAFLNPDTQVTAGWLEGLISALESKPYIGLVTPKIMLMSDRSHINACGHQVHLTGIVQCRGMNRSQETFQHQEEISAVSGAAFLIRRELFEKLGGFDSPFFMYIEDTDISWRAWLAGYRCLYIPEVCIRHDYCLTFGPQKMFYYERNRYLLMLKNLRWATILFLFPALMLTEMIGWCFVLLYDRRNWRNKFSAYAWIGRHWKSIMSERKRAQKLRIIRDRDLLQQTTYRMDYTQVGEGILTCMAQWVFDPLFFFIYILAILLVWW